MRLSKIIKKLREGDEPMEDHEVHMAQSSLDQIIKSAMELKEKIGNVEKDLPAWVQDHITNSENFITQANKGYYDIKKNQKKSEK